MSLARFHFTRGRLALEIPPDEETSTNTHLPRPTVPGADSNVRSLPGIVRMTPRRSGRSTKTDRRVYSTFSLTQHRITGNLAVPARLSSRPFLPL